MFQKLQISISEKDMWNEDKEEFIHIDSKTLCFEHSLFTISKWESIWKESWFVFMSMQEKDQDKFLSYIHCMCLNDISLDVIYSLEPSILEKIIKYIEEDITATTIQERGNKNSKNKIITSELIYYWMTASNIPFECEHWHFSRLMTLILVASIEGNPDDKMSKQETLNYYRAMNAARRKKK
jgi:hypothetical protein